MNEKDFMEKLKDLDDESVEEIAENYPVLDENSKNRILKQCMKKSGLPDSDIEITENTDIYENAEEENSVSGIERYDRPLWHRYAGSAAALIVAVVGIASVVVLHGNMNNNDNFDISNPPVISDGGNGEQSQKTQIVSGSYIDKGYNANGVDYAAQNDYQGMVVGGTTTAITSEITNSSTEVSDIPEPDDNQYYDTPEQNEEEPEQPTEPAANSPVTNPPATNSTATNPPTTNLSTTISPVVESQTADLSVTGTTETTTVEPQKTFIEGRYFVSINDSAGVTYDGFEFSADGTIKPFLFDMPDGNFKRYKDETFGYEIIENQFSYGAIGDESNWKIGTIIDPNDGTSFAVQFGNDVYTFDTNASDIFPTVTSGIILSGVWYGDSTYGIRKFEFHDDVSGIFNFAVAEEIVGFEYKIENEHVYLKLNSGEVSEGNILNPYDGQSFSVLWDDGTTESFYSEQKWLGLNP